MESSIVMHDGVNMKIRDARGQNMKILKVKNRVRVQRYFEKNPEASKTEAKRALNMAYNTLQRHLKDLGWV